MSVISKLYLRVVGAWPFNPFRKKLDAAGATTVAPSATRVKAMAASASEVKRIRKEVWPAMAENRDETGILEPGRASFDEH